MAKSRQLSWTGSGWPVREEASSYNEDTGILELQHTVEDQEAGLRAFMPEVMAALNATWMSSPLTGVACSCATAPPTRPSSLMPLPRSGSTIRPATSPLPEGCCQSTIHWSKRCGCSWLPSSSGPALLAAQCADSSSRLLGSPSHQTPFRSTAQRDGGTTP